MLRKGLVFLVVVAVLGLAALGGCATEQDIPATAKDDGRFSTLTDALESANLTQTLKEQGPYTLFAPTDEAFNKLPDGMWESLMNDIPALTDVLLYHVVPGEITSDNIAEVNSVTTLQGDNLSISVEPPDQSGDNQTTDNQSGDNQTTDNQSGDNQTADNQSGDNQTNDNQSGDNQTTGNQTVMVNNAEVTEADINCSNGVIHAIDTVLLPPGDIVAAITTDGRFSTLLTALQAADMVDTLKGEGPYTVFAPTDEAFNQLPQGTLDSLLNDPQALSNVLLYHVAEGKLMSDNIADVDSVTTLLGEDLTISTQTTDNQSTDNQTSDNQTTDNQTSDNQSTDNQTSDNQSSDNQTSGNQTVMVNNAKIVESDIPATNGVIHAIDKVLTPPQDIMSTASADQRFQPLVAALQTANLSDTLKEEGPYTLFVPSAEAFNNLPQGELQALLSDTARLRDVLLYHVVEGKLTLEDLKNRSSATTLMGEDLNFSVTDNTVMVNDAQIVEADIQCTNGVIHVINAVLMPPGS